MLRAPHILLIAAAGLCSCATERTVTTGLQTRPENKGARTEKELESDLMNKFAGGFGLQRDKDGNTKMVSDKRSSFEGYRYSGDTSEIAKKAFATTEFEKKRFDGASSKFETKTWDGIKAFKNGKMETPDFIAHAKGVNTPAWQDSGKEYATRKAEFQGRSWKEADRQIGREVNQNIEDKRKSFQQPSMMNVKEAQARTIQETREMMGRTD